MKIEFVYTLENELTRVKELLARKDFYKENSYRIRLPQGYTLANDNYSGIEIKVKEEFDNDKVKQTMSSISKKWKQYSDQLHELFVALQPETPQSIRILLTQYGTSGSYLLPNEVILNVNSHMHFVTLIHEFIHCLVEERIVAKNKLEHSKKEGLIDWLFVNNDRLNKIFPDYKIQKRSELPNKQFIKEIGWDRLSTTE